MALIGIVTSMSPEFITTYNKTAVNPIGTPIYWFFNTETTGQPNAKAKLVIRFNSIINKGEVLSITRYNGTSSFVVADNPSLYELQAGVVASLQAEAFTQMLNEHPEFKPYYFAVYSVVALVGLVTITARFPGAKYNLDSTFSGLGINSTVLQLGTDIDQGGALKDFSIKVKLFVNKNVNSKLGLTAPITFTGSDWVELPNLLEAKYSTDRYMAIDFSESLKPFVFCSPPLLTNFNIYALPEMLVKYYFEIYASYIPAGSTTPRLFKITEIGNGSAITDPKLYAVSSSLPSYEQPVRIHERYQWFWQRKTTPDKVNFLTAVPPEKVTHVDSYEFLYWVYYQISNRNVKLSGLTVIYDLYFEDGTSLLDKRGLVAYPSAKSVFTTQVGYTQIRRLFGDIETTQGSLIRKFDVRIAEALNNSTTDLGSDITVRQTFVLDNTTRCKSFETAQLIFRNPYGGFDTFRFTGYYEKSIKATTKPYSKNPTWRNNVDPTKPLLQQAPIDTYFLNSPPRLNDPTLLSAIGITESANYENENQTRFKLKSGYITRAEMDWLKTSLFTSNEAYLVSWTDPENLGNPNQPLMRRVVFEDRELSIDSYLDQFAFEITVVAGMQDNQLNG